MNDLWLKAHIERRGHLLVATVGTVNGGDAKMFEMSVDMRPIAAAVKRYHQSLHGSRVSGDCVGCDQVGFFGLGKLVKKISRNKLVRKVGSVAKYAKYASPMALQAAILANKKHRKRIVRVAKYTNPLALQAAILANKKHRKRIVKAVKSKRLGALTAAVAVAFPPVGVPALAAYASANATLKAVENGNKIAAKMKSLTKASKWLALVKKKLKGKSKKKLAASLKKNRRMKLRLKKALAAKRRLRAIQRSKKLRAHLKAAMARRAKARKTMRNVSNTARYSADARKRAQAQKAAAVMVAAANARARLKQIQAQKSPGVKAGDTGIIITKSGPVRGKFVRSSKPLGDSPDVLMLGTRSELGHFDRVGGGCIGCGLFEF